MNLLTLYLLLMMQMPLEKPVSGHLSVHDYKLFNSHILHSPIEFRVLTWQDYKGPIEVSAKYVASTATELDLLTTQDGNRFYFEVKAFMLPDQSYTTTESETVLRHENVHLQIVEWFARCLKIELRRYQGCLKYRSWDAEQIYDKYVRMMNMMQKDFDKSTDHGRNAKIEAEWEQKLKWRLGHGD